MPCMVRISGICSVFFRAPPLVRGDLREVFCGMMSGELAVDCMR